MLLMFVYIVEDGEHWLCVVLDEKESSVRIIDAGTLSVSQQPSMGSVCHGLCREIGFYSTEFTIKGFLALILIYSRQSIRWSKRVTVSHNHNIAYSFLSRTQLTMPRLVR